MRSPRKTAYVLVSTDHGPLIVNRHDYCITGDGQGFGVGFQLLNRSSFDMSEVCSVLALLSLRRRYHGDGVNAIDCGANIGVHTVEWSRHMHGWGRVTAFEPQERVFQALAGNVALNNCFNARVRWAAVGAASGSMSIPVLDPLVPGSFGSLELRDRHEREDIGQPVSYAHGDMDTVEVVSIDMLAPSRLDLIKIDVEGMELEVLAGAAHTLTTCRPVMLIETIKTDVAVLGRVLEDHGYRAFPAGLNVVAVHRDDPVLAHLSVGPQGALISL